MRAPRSRKRQHVVLINWTEEGIKTVKTVQKRTERAHETFKSFGAQISHLYYTFGRYDVIAIAEAPDDKTMAKAVLTIAKRGNARFETVRASPEEVGFNIFRELP